MQEVSQVPKTFFNEDPRKKSRGYVQSTNCNCAICFASFRPIVSFSAFPYQKLSPLSGRERQTLRYVAIGFDCKSGGPRLQARLLKSLLTVEIIAS